jgi:ATPase family AAA domain-containing protein 3A/B
MFVFYRRFKLDEWDYTACCSKMAKLVDGMSGREISKLGVAWQAAVYSSEEGVLTEKMVLDRCEAAVYQHKQKVKRCENCNAIENKSNFSSFQMAWLSEQEQLDHKSITPGLKPTSS